MLANIFHFTNDMNCCNDGERIPGVWFNSRQFSLQIATSLNGNHNHLYNTDFQLPADRYTDVVIQQIQSLNNEYIYGIFIDGDEKYFKTNIQPNEYDNVKVYASDPFYSTASAYIQDFKYESPIARGIWFARNESILQLYYDIKVHKILSPFNQGWTDLSLSCLSINTSSKRKAYVVVFYNQNIFNLIQCVVFTSEVKNMRGEWKKRQLKTNSSIQIYEC